MSCLSLSLLCAAALLQSSASSNNGVSLECNETVDVGAGETATINCTIKYDKDWGCKGVQYRWLINGDGDTRDPCPSGLMKYNCEWDNLTYVALTVSNVTGETNCTVYVETNCGTAKSSVKVRAEQRSRTIHGRHKPPQGSEKALVRSVIPAVLGIAGTFVVLGILFVLYGRKIIKCIKKGKTRGDHRDTDTAPMEGSLMP